MVRIHTHILLKLFLLLLSATTVSAANITVTNTNNTGAGSLRAAITAAAPGDTILFAPGLSGTITLASSLTINKNLTIIGPGADLLTISGNNNVRVLSIGTSASIVNISGLTIANGRATNGGGIQINTTGTVNLTNCAITNNSAFNAQIAVATATGGGIQKINNGTLNITGCTFSGNSASGAAFAVGSGFGGALASAGGTVNITNSTFYANLANGFTLAASIAVGGSIFNVAPGTMSITNSTIVGNIATATTFIGSLGLGGGIANGVAGVGEGTVQLKNTIVARNSATTTGADVSGSFVSQGYNLIGSNNGSTGFANGVNNDKVGSDVTPINPLLAPFGYYGGATQTLPLIPGSPAIDMGMAVAGLTTDQRGFSRPVDFADVPNAPGGNASDIGAFERQDPEAFVPGIQRAENVRVTDQKAGSVLVFPYYTSDASGNFIQSDTLITITNVSNDDSFINGIPNYQYLHLFFMKDCSPADTFACLTPNGSIQILASAYDPTTTGYLIAIAVDAEGVPIQNNSFIGNAFVRDEVNGVIDSYGAEAFASLNSAPVPQSGGSAIIALDGVNYEAPPQEFSVQLQDPALADQTLVLASVGGDLGSNLNSIKQGNVGLLYRADEAPASFQPSLGSGCFISRAITNQNFRIVPGNLSSFLKDSYGYIKFNVSAPAVGLLFSRQGVIGQSKNRFAGIRTLHKTGTGYTALFVPVFPPYCI